MDVVELMMMKEMMKKDHTPIIVGAGVLAALGIGGYLVYTGVLPNPLDLIDDLMGENDDSCTSATDCAAGQSCQAGVCTAITSCTSAEMSGQCRDSSYYGVGGAKVEVRARVGQPSGDTVLYSATADANGYYSIQGIAPGVYRIKWYDSSGVYDGMEEDPVEIGTLATNCIKTKDLPMRLHVESGKIKTLTLTPANAIQIFRWASEYIWKSTNGGSDWVCTDSEECPHGYVWNLRALAGIPDTVATYNVSGVAGQFKKKQGHAGFWYHDLKVRLSPSPKGAAVANMSYLWDNRKWLSPKFTENVVHNITAGAIPNLGTNNLALWCRESHDYWGGHFKGPSLAVTVEWNE